MFRSGVFCFLALMVKGTFIAALGLYAADMESVARQAFGAAIVLVYFGLIGWAAARDGS